MKIKEVEIAHPEKILFSDSGISKKDIAEYFEQIAPYMIPFIQDRPLTMKRYPKGIDEDGFFNKHAPKHFPDFIPRFTVPMEQESSQMQMVGVEKPKDLIYLAGQDVIELHMALSRIDDIKKPDQIIFDFDPSDDDFEKVRSAALKLKHLLDHLNLPSFIKTSGSRGVHIHIPIRVDHTFKEVKAIARNIAQRLNEICPDITTMEQRKVKRGNKVFIDYLRNDFSMTAIAPYSLRACKGAPIATPIDWEELEDQSLGPQTYHIKNILRRLAQKGNDPWGNFVQSSVNLQSRDL